MYVRVNPEWSLDREAIERRLGEGAKVGIEESDAEGMLDLELSDTRDDARASALWRERAQLLEELAGLRTGVGGTYADNRGSASLVPAAYTIN